ncbi:hypothetical protein STXM2123_4276 [Streptomyces sp. F-3]|uniref:Secreted protein n=1 Tax=Streptomyces thermogriseus TaxID=75292 RepID=A0ABN1SZV6_9ACTN|nr:MULTISPECIES: hypothetical protein [Streptomyces]MDN5383030.1 hypothetical protein [Streptomyces sp. LB8]GAT83575.1 hypothetical protein STXM2123_4276 [Streptomyces sp. F-3]
MRVPIRRLVVALTLCCALLVGTSSAWAADQNAARPEPTVTMAAPEPTPTTPQERQKFAKTRFVANAALAAGAVYQWIWKPYKEGRFKKGAKHRRVTLVKAGLAGAFAYNRLKAAVRNAKGDPALSKAVAPVTKGIDDLKQLPSKLRKGDDSAVKDINDTINEVKKAGKSAGAEVKDKVPSTSELYRGAKS